MAAPSTPATPSPAHGEAGASTTPSLTWTAPGATSCRVYIGPTPALVDGDGQPHVAAVTRSGVGVVDGNGLWMIDVNARGVPLGHLAPLAAPMRLYWRVVAINADGVTVGPAWTFSTTALEAPSALNPVDGAPDVTGLSLTWTAPGATSYDVYFGASSPPTLVASGQADASYAPGALSPATTYYWRIVARDDVGSRVGPVWSFVTAAAPATPNSPAPEDAATADGVALSWLSARAVEFDVYLDTVNPPVALVSAAQASASYAAAGLVNGTTYYWKVVARNIAGETAGPVWSFVQEAEAVTVLTTTSVGTQNDFNVGALGLLSILRCTNASLLTITGITNNGAMPTDGMLLWIEALGAGRVDLANVSSGSSVGKKILNSVAGTMSLAGVTNGQPGGSALLAYDSTAGYWRVVQHEQGAWIDVPFNAADFTAESGSWAVAAGDLKRFCYCLKGRTLFVSLTVQGGVVSGTPSYLMAKIPGGFLPPDNYIMAPAGFALVAGSYEPCYVEAGQWNTVRFWRGDRSAWLAGAMWVDVTIAIEVS